MFLEIYNADGEPIGMHIEDTSTWGWLVSEIAKKLDGRVPYMMYSTYRGLYKMLQARPDELVYDVVNDYERGVRILNASDPEAYTRASEAVREAEAALETAKRRREEERGKLVIFDRATTLVFPL